MYPLTLILDCLLYFPRCVYNSDKEKLSFCCYCISPTFFLNLYCNLKIPFWYRSLIWKHVCLSQVSQALICEYIPQYCRSTVYWWWLKWKVPLIFHGMNNVLWVDLSLFWRYYNDKKVYRILPFKMPPPPHPTPPTPPPTPPAPAPPPPPCNGMRHGAWRPHHERWAYTSNFVQYISGFWMNINDEIRPKYITL